jgi:subtilisin
MSDRMTSGGVRLAGADQLPPWRREPRGHFPGVPAWGIPSENIERDLVEAGHMSLVSPEWAWGGSDGSGVRVCVLDSGIDGAHPLVGSVDRSMSVVAGHNGDLDVAEVEPSDLAGHGTACASVIRSLAPGVSLSSMRVLTDGKHGSGSALLAGLTWAIDEGFDVINMSLSTTKTEFYPALHELADRAYFRRCVLVASAHNMPVRSFPWPFASVISVASHDKADSMLYYYNPSPPVDFLAKGVRVRVAWPGGSQMSSTGNSFATPHITAICALILSKHPLLTPFQLKSVLYLAAGNVAKPDGGTRAAE